MYNNSQQPEKPKAPDAATIEKLKSHRKRFKARYDEDSDWRKHAAELVDFLIPRQGRYLKADDEPQGNENKKKNDKIINGFAVDAIKVAAAWLRGGISSPSSPWFSLTIGDKALAETWTVKSWLSDCQERMMQVFAKSNFYSTSLTVYKQLFAVGTALNFIDEDLDTVVRFRPCAVGEYTLELDASLRVEGAFRRFPMSASALEEKFGKSVLPDAVKNCLEKQPNKKFVVIHYVYKNKKLDPERADRRGMAYCSDYFLEKGNDEDGFLREAGYETKPFQAPRFEVVGSNEYGDAPGMDVLPDVKMLQVMEQKILRALAKVVDPVMNADPSMRKYGATMVPGTVNFVDRASGTDKGFTPAYQIQPDFASLEAKVSRVEDRIRNTLGLNYFLAVTGLGDRSEKTAFEIAKRLEEQALVMGPILEAVQGEYLGPAIDRVWDRCMALGIFDPPPPEIPIGTDIKVEYTSILAQAQKQVGLAAIERTIAFAGSASAYDPNALKKINFTEAVDEFANRTGATPRIIRPDEEVAQLIQAENQQKQMMQMAAAAQPMKDVAGAMKSAADTKVGDKNLLEQMTGR